MNIAGLILAAGASTRLGRPKQLLKAQGKPLLEKATEAALEARLDGVYVVLGARYEEIKTSIRHLPAQLIRNEQWQDGIGSSLSSGIRAIRTSNNYDAVLIMLSDQLHVNGTHLSALVNTYLKSSHKAIVATTYGHQTGVPALFDQFYFPQLENLSGDTGAKKVIRQHMDRVLSVNFEQASIDIDTPEDQAKAGLA
jgi:molybdenum cofactor cytidylyltransferase